MASVNLNSSRVTKACRPNPLLWSHIDRYLLPLVFLALVTTTRIMTTTTMAFCPPQMIDIVIPSLSSNLFRHQRQGSPFVEYRAFGIMYNHRTRATLSLADDHLSEISPTIDEDDYKDEEATTVTMGDDEDLLEDGDIDSVFFTEAERKANPPIDLPKGKSDGFYVVKQYNIPSYGFEREIRNILDGVEVDRESRDGDEADTESRDGYEARVNDDNNDRTSNGITGEDLRRLNVMDGKNITLPIALMLLDPEEYPSFSRARKACRKGYIIIHKGPLDKEYVFNQDKCVRGRVRNRVYPNDVIAKQVRMGGGFYPSESYRKPPFDLPVVYEDDHMAIVNKPSGVVVYSHRKGGHGIMTVRAALPFVLQPPRRGTRSILRRPMVCHRLDRPTSGLLIIAKTKPAMVDVTRQFVERNIKKTYTAIVNGIPNEPVETRMSTAEAHGIGVDVLDYLDVGFDGGDESSNDDDHVSWQIIDYSLREKSAITVWRPLKFVKSLKANDGVLTLVELKPKTGRYHQLRRHMAWVRNCPLVGDSTYDGGGDAMQLRERGLFLCSNKLRLDHPYYNTIAGRKEWDALPDADKWAGGKIRLSNDGSVVEMYLSIDLPNKFDSFLSREEQRDAKFYNN